MKIRVAINIQESLNNGWNFEGCEGDKVHVYFKYKKLGMLYFFNDILDHL